MNSLLGLALASVIFWFLVITGLSIQWFIPLRARMHDKFFKCLKKCYIVFFDNAFFSIGVFIYTLFLYVLSILFVFLIPSFSGVLLALNNALRLRMYKYDWMEQHPELTPKEARKNIPWEELIAEDRDTVGPRNLKSFIFPWK
jgi:hypothetical protein